MPKLTKMLRDLHTLRLEIDAEIARQGLPPGTTPEQLAALTTEAYEEGFTTGMNRKRGRKPGLKSKPIPKSRKRRKPGPKPKAKDLSKKEARNLHDRTRRAIIKTLGNKALTRGQIAEKSGLDPELVSTCIHSSRGVFVQTAGHRWRVANVEPARPPKDAPKKERKPFKQVVAEVMGKRTMSAPEVVEALQAKGRMPKSKRPVHYLHVTLANHQDTFERVEKGRYRVAQ